MIPDLGSFSLSSVRIHGLKEFGVSKIVGTPFGNIGTLSPVQVQIMSQNKYEISFGVSPNLASKNQHLGILLPYHDSLKIGKVGISHSMK